MKRFMLLLFRFWINVIAGSKKRKLWSSIMRQLGTDAMA